MSYHIVNEDQHKFTVKHPNGSHFFIAKAGLDKNVLSKIKKLPVLKMSSGGEVPDPVQDLESSPSSQSSQNGPLVDPTLGMPSVTPGASGDYVEPDDQRSLGDKVSNILVGGGENPPQYGRDGITLNPSLPEASSTSQALPSPPSDRMPSSTPGASQVALPNLAGISGQAFSEMKKGAQGMADAEKLKSSLTDQALQDYQTQAQKLQSEYAPRLQAISAKEDEAEDAYRNGKVDPNRVWGSMSTGSKVGAAIGILLSGLGGGGANGTPNLALDVINKSIDRDVDAQKANLNKQGTLLNFYRQKFGDTQAALAQAKLDQLTATKIKIEQAAAKAGTPLADAQMRYAFGQIDLERMKQANTIALSQIGRSLAGGNTNGVNPEMLPPEMRERAVNVPGAGGQSRLALAPSKEAAQKFRDSEMETENLNKNVDDLMKARLRAGYSPNPLGSDNALLSSMRDTVVSSLGKLHDLNRLNDHEFEMYSNMVPGPQQINGDRAIVQLQRLKQVIANKRNAAASNLLEGYNPGSIKESPKK